MSVDPEYTSPSRRNVLFAGVHDQAHECQLCSEIFNDPFLNEDNILSLAIHLIMVHEVKIFVHYSYKDVYKYTPGGAGNQKVVAVRLA